MRKEFSDVFPGELPSLPPERVDLPIELLHGISPICRAPYRMALIELKELKTQLRNKISIITDISILGFYGYIENISKYWWIF